jgi:hypothetical protein
MNDNRKPAKADTYWSCKNFLPTVAKKAVEDDEEEEYDEKKVPTIVSEEKEEGKENSTETKPLNFSYNEYF